MTAPRTAWRCEGCGRVSNATARPSSHRRGGEKCGPFASAVIAEEGAVLAPAGATITQAPARQADPALRYRQSTLRSYTACPRSTILAASDVTTGTVGSSADLGSAFHAVAAEILKTLRRVGESQIATEDAIAIMREVTAAGPWILDAEDYNGSRNPDGTQAGCGLVQMVCNFATELWKPSRFMAIEQRLSHGIPCPDGEVRLFTGTPDLVIADPGNPPGAVICDWKTGMARPTTPREQVPDGEAIRGAQYLSEGGYFQLVGYGALAMLEWPQIQRVTLREKNWRWMGPPREATLSRHELEHVLPYVGLLMMQLDQGLREGEGSEFAQPRPGRQCLTRCPVSLSCPVPAEQRGVGAIGTPDAADEAARRWVAIRALDAQLRKDLKAWHEESGHCPEVGDGTVVRWDGEKPGRKFGVHPPALPADPGVDADEAFMAQWEAELARRTVAA